MNLSIAYVKNENQVMFHDFSVQESQKDSRAQILNIEDLEAREMDTIFVPANLLDNETIIEKIGKESKFTPIKTVKEDELTAATFENIAASDAATLTKKVNTSWALHNNLNLLENLFENLQHLKALWPNDRTTFFEELWYLLKNNLGAKNLKLAYNHMQKAQKENEKNQLIRVVIEGNKIPNPTENKELGDALFKNYEGKFSQNFELHSYDVETGKVVILGSINNSPIIVMAETYGPTKLQKSLLTALFDGLQGVVKK